MKDRVLHILIAPNAFKNSLDATAAALAIQEGLNRSNLNCSCTCFPIADGGDGTAKLLVEHTRGSLIPAEVSDPLGRKIHSVFGLTDQGHTAVIEMADASGIRLLQRHELQPLQATSYGTGQLIEQALNKGARNIIIAMGGSATVDGGCGILQALGIRFLDAAGQPLEGMPASLVKLAAIDISGLDTRIADCQITILCDVNNTLLGNEGAAAVFGPQKGASANDVELLEAALARFAEIALKTTSTDMSAIPRGGTAGGAAAGLHTFLNACLVNGIDRFLQLTGFEEALKRSNLLITAEGSIDEQTLQGKGPFGVASLAKSRGIPVIGLAGRVPLHESNELRQYFDTLIAIGNEPAELPAALENTRQNLSRTATAIGNMLSFNEAYV